MMREDATTQILTLMVNNKRYGILLDEVAEVLFMMSFQELPNVPEFVAGVVNLRGDLIPVLDFLELICASRNIDFRKFSPHIYL